MNKEITLIDLLDMNAKGEKMPSKIKFEDNIYKLTDYGYEAENGDELYGLINFDGSNLNETVEIIEDNDKLEKMQDFDLTLKETNVTKDLELTYEGVSKTFNYAWHKIDGIIDHINKIEEKLENEK